MPNVTASKPPDSAAQAHSAAFEALQKLDERVLKRERETPMHVLIRMGLFDVFVFEQLLQRNPQMVHVKNLVWATPLHVAAEAGDTHAIAWLLQRDAKINAQQRAGYTPFLVAAGGRQAEAMQLLLDQGADPHIASTWCGGLADVLELAPGEMAHQEPWLVKALAPPPPKKRFFEPKNAACRAELEAALLSGCDI